MRLPGEKDITPDFPITPGRQKANTRKSLLSSVPALGLLDFGGLSGSDRLLRGEVTLHILLVKAL
jgi:hypothetical protein